MLKRKGPPNQNLVHKQTRDTVRLIWLTIVGYIIYLEFFKETLTTIGPAAV